METFFLACFTFGALFTVLSVLLGFAQTGGHGAGSGHAGDLGSGGFDASGGAHGVAHGEVGHGSGAANGHGGAHQAHPTSGHGRLPIFNLSSLMAFLTWFGGAGYVLLRFAGWSLIAAAGVALAVGGAGAVFVALILAKLLASGGELDPLDFRLEGTVSRVTVSIPADGVGEIVFSKAGRLRSEAARSATGEAIPRSTEVVVVEYAQGVASVRPRDGAGVVLEPDVL